jgi:hypothetical protein
MGEEQQRFQEGKEAAMPQDAPPNGSALDLTEGPWSRVAEMHNRRPSVPAALVCCHTEIGSALIHLLS